jgi:hypothetical protein
MRNLELSSAEVEELFDLVRNEIDAAGNYEQEDPDRVPRLKDLEARLAWLLPGPCSRCKSTGCHPAIVTVDRLPVCYDCLTDAENTES